MPPSQKKTEISKKTGHVEVDFRSAPREISHFNQYAIEKVGDFFQISLWYFDSFSGSIPVFRGLIWQPDLKVSVEGLKRYIEKIGLNPGNENYSVRPPIWNSPPVSFNIFDCVSRNECSEVSIKNFSHKSVMDAAASKTNVLGTIHGVYVSAGSIHRSLVADLINKFSS